MGFKILSALLRSSWAIDDRFAMAHGAIVASLLNGQLPAASFGTTENSKSLPFLIFEDNQVESGTPISDLSGVTSPSIAVIPVRGPLMKMDQEDCDYFNAGMDTLGERVLQADKNPNITSIILYIDSPGGTVDGTQAFADIIKSSQTPVVAFVDGCMASAALWIGTSARYVIAQNPTTEIGSIGVMVAFADMQPVWEAEGVKFHRIMADQSSDKNRPVIDALAGNYKTIKDQELNPLADMFISAVKANRPNLPDSIFTGKMYFAKEALSLGLIDSIGSFNSAIAAATALAATQPLNNTTHQPINPSTHQPTSIHNKQKIKSMNFPLLIALLQVSAIEATDDGIFLNMEQVQAIEDALKANAENVQNLISAHQTALDDANQRASAAESARSAAEDLRAAAVGSNTAAASALDEIHPNIAAAKDIPAKVQAIRNILSKNPGTPSTGIQSKKDPSVSMDGVDWDTLNALPHMQEHD
ncbi:MAG: S49 family peptidase [Bacteroidales bacterium]